MGWIFAYLGANVLVGLLACFYGKKMYYPLLALAAFLCAFMICVAQFGFDTKGLLIALAVGLLAGVLAKVFYKLGVFLVGLLGGAVIGLLLAGVLQLSGWMRVLVILVPAVVVGVCALNWCNLFIMLSTAFSGAAAVATSLCMAVLEFGKLGSFAQADGLTAVQNLSDHMNNVFVPQHALLLLVITAVLGFVGFMYQHRHHRA